MCGFAASLPPPVDGRPKQPASSAAAANRLQQQTCTVASRRRDCRRGGQWEAGRVGGRGADAWASAALTETKHPAARMCSLPGRSPRGGAPRTAAHYKAPPNQPSQPGSATQMPPHSQWMAAACRSPPPPPRPPPTPLEPGRCSEGRHSIAAALPLPPATCEHPATRTQRAGRALCWPA